GSSGRGICLKPILWYSAQDASRSRTRRPTFSCLMPLDTTGVPPCASRGATARCSRRWLPRGAADLTCPPPHRVCLRQPATGGAVSASVAARRAVRDHVRVLL